MLPPVDAANGLTGSRPPPPDDPPLEAGNGLTGKLELTLVEDGNGLTGNEDGDCGRLWTLFEFEIPMGMEFDWKFGAGRGGAGGTGYVGGRFERGALNDGDCDGRYALAMPWLPRGPGGLEREKQAINELKVKNIFFIFVKIHTFANVIINYRRYASMKVIIPVGVCYISYGDESGCFTVN